MGSGSASFDWLGAALSTASLVTFLLVMTSGPRLGWLYPPVIGGIFALVAFVASFIWWELRCETPMIDVRLFKSRIVSLGVAAQFISFIGNSSTRFLLPFYMQAALGFSPQQIGLIFVPSSIAMIVTGPLSGRLSDRFGYRWFTVGGLMLSVCGLLLLSTLTTESSVWIVAIGMLLQTSGAGTFYPPNNSSIMQQVPESRYGVMSGFINLVRNSANITGYGGGDCHRSGRDGVDGLPAEPVVDCGDGGYRAADGVRGGATDHVHHHCRAGGRGSGILVHKVGVQPSGSRRRGEADGGAIMAEV